MVKKIITSELILLLVFYNTGCYYYSQIDADKYHDIEYDEEVKITTLSEDIYILNRISIEKDVIKGTNHSVYPIREHEISVKDIAKIEVERNSPIFILIIGAVVIGSIIIADDGLNIDLRNVGK